MFIVVFKVVLFFYFSNKKKSFFYGLYDLMRNRVCWFLFVGEKWHKFIFMVLFMLLISLSFSLLGESQHGQQELQGQVCIFIVYFSLFFFILSISDPNFTFACMFWLGFKLTWEKKKELVKRRIVWEKESKRVKEKYNLEGRKGKESWR
jgi:hypothetical protein